jgi:cytochrome c553
MRTLLHRTALATGLAIAATVAQAQQPPEPSVPAGLGGDMPAAASSCLSCHGVDGRPILIDVPIIAGQQPIYLRNALRAYRSGTRTGGQALVMQEIVKTLSDDDMDALASWFGGQ